MLQLIKYDIRLQWRQGFWLVYFIVTLIYLLILFSLPPGSRHFISLLFVLMDTSVLGVVFVGALVLLEKQQNVLQSLFVTPLKLRTYLFSKTISLTILALFMSMGIYFPVAGFSRGTLLLMALVLISSAFFMLVGIGVSARVSTLNQYLGKLILAGLVIIVPVIPFVLVENSGWMRIFPSNALYDLALIIYSGSPGGMAVADLIILVLWLVVSWFYAETRFQKHVMFR